MSITQLDQIVKETDVHETPFPIITSVGIDAALVIFSFLSHKDRFAFSCVCKFTNSLMMKLPLKKTVELSRILGCSYYNKFTHIVATGQMIYDMKRLKKKLPECITDLTLHDYKGYLPTLTRDCKKLVHLTLEKSCVITVKNNCLPPGLTHLSWKIRQPLPKVFPAGLVNLRLENYQPIGRNLDKLPDTITHLLIEKACDFHIADNCLPKNLKTLKLNSRKVTKEPKITAPIEKLIIDNKSEKSITVGDENFSSKNLKVLVVSTNFMEHRLSDKNNLGEKMPASVEYIKKIMTPKVKKQMILSRTSRRHPFVLRSLA